MASIPLQNQDNLIWNRRYLPNKATNDEDVVMVVREDLSILGFKTFRLILVFFVLLMLRILAAGFLDAPWLYLYDTIFYTINTIMVVVFGLMFHNYYLSLQIVTNKRIIDIDQRDLFHREVNEVAIHNVEDVTYKQKTFWATLFAYGDVVIQSSGVGTESETTSPNGFVFNNVPSPAEVQACISNLYHRDRDREQLETAKMNAEHIARAFNQAYQR